MEEKGVHGERGEEERRREEREKVKENHSEVEKGAKEGTKYKDGEEEEEFRGWRKRMKKMEEIWYRRKNQEESMRGR